MSRSIGPYAGETMAVRSATRWFQRPVARDSALACGLLAACAAVSGTAAVTSLGWWVVVGGALVALGFRRRWPLPMLALALAVAVVDVVSDAPPLFGQVPLLVLVYTVAACCGRTASLAALATLVLLVAGWTTVFGLADRPAPGIPVLSFDVGARPDAPATTTTADRPPARRASPSPGTGAAGVCVALVAAWAFGFGTGNRRAYLGQLRARAEDLERQRDQQAALSAADERERISRELHDVVAHGLSVIVVQAQGAAAALDQRPSDARTALEAIVTTGRESLADMRRVLDALGDTDDAWHPPLGLAQLPALLEQVRSAGTPVRFRADGEPTTLPATVDLTVYRVVQEALTNTRRHASAGAGATVRLGFGHTTVTVEIRDDGAVADRPPTNGNGNGLRGMRERVRLLGGQLHTGPEPGGGFLVEAILPIEGRSG